jgi:hypothetical protein
MGLLISGSGVRVSGGPHSKPLNFRRLLLARCASREATEGSAAGLTTAGFEIAPDAASGSFSTSLPWGSRRQTSGRTCARVDHHQVGLAMPSCHITARGVAPPAKHERRPCVPRSVEVLRGLPGAVEEAVELPVDDAFLEWRSHGARQDEVVTLPVRTRLDRSRSCCSGACGAIRGFPVRAAELLLPI